MNLHDNYGSWACVAGAGEGLGAAFSFGLAHRRFNLILIDKDEEKLNDIQKQLQGKYKLEIQILKLDLQDRNSVDVISESLEHTDCRFMVYNAAYGPVKPFLSNTPEELDLYLNVNMKTPLHLSYRFAHMNQKKQAGLLLISSLAGFRGTQFVIPYAASKAFLWNLAEGLYYEFKDTQLDVSVCCPGSIDTPNFRSTKPQKTFVTPKPMKPALVAEEALNKFGKKLFILPGITNKLVHFILNRILPRKIASAIHNSTMKKMYS
jgi:short-subunit dehydrogenase